MNKLLTLLLGVFLFSSCASVEKYNKQISSLHSVASIHEDIDESYKILQRLHPDLYWFTPKDSLDFAFSQLKESIDKPLSSRDFYKQLAPVIAKIKQGHTSVSPPYIKQTRKEKKAKGKRSSPFKRVRFKGIVGKVYIEKTFKKKDSLLLVGSEVLSVNGESTKSLLKSYDNLVSGDGYNTTFLPKIKSKYFGVYYLKSHGERDSIKLDLKYKDSLYSHYLVESFSKIKDTTQKKAKPKRLGKRALKQEKKKKKAKKKWNKMVGFNKYTKEQTRIFKFINQDSINVAYIKIRRFKTGDPEAFYEDAFKKIDSAKVQHLIIDLRDNLGGSLAQVADVYSYLTDKDYVLLEDSEMTSRWSYMYPVMHSKSFLFKSLGILFSPIYTPYIQALKVKSRNGKHFFRNKYAKEQEFKENNYKGKLYVIINGTSYSASSTLSTHLKATKRATFVGEETGGTYNATVAGMFVYKDLPNTKVSMRFGVMRIKTPYTGKPDGYGIKPDVYIPTTTLEKDEQLEWILKDINGE
ncbi:MAG TPA: peptidase S41 [Lutibacter sp.]|nr:peptidase S41 [Lutibacter sp.]